MASLNKTLKQIICNQWTKLCFVWYTCAKVPPTQNKCP